MRCVIRNLRGVVLASTDNPAPERFFNLCRMKKIRIWDITKTDKGCQFSIGAADYLQLKEPLKKCGMKLVILRKTGLPFFMFRYRKHYSFVAGMLLAASLLQIMSMFVWEIEVDGNSYYTDNVIVSYLQGNDVYVGCRMSKVMCDSLEQKIRKDFDDITWVSARLEGTRLVVEIEENNTASAKEKEQTPCSLKASKSGIIARMITRRGTPLVKKGDQVEKGDLLVSGLLPIYNDSQEIVGYEKTNASADVWIKYEENIEITIPRSQTVRHYTSKKVHLGLVLFGHRFCLPQSLMASDQEELYIEQHQWKLFEHFYLPFYNEEYCLMKYENATVCYDDESLKKQADQKYLEFIIQLEKLGVEIIENNVTIESGPKDYRMNVQFLLEANASEKCTLESQVQELQKQE